MIKKTLYDYGLQSSARVAWIRECFLNIAKRFGIGHLEQVASLPLAEVVESRGVSFDCLRDILLHTIDAEERFVNYVISGKAQDWVSRNPEEFQDIDSIRKRARDVESRTKVYLVNMKTEELERKVARACLEKGCRLYRSRLKMFWSVRHLRISTIFGELIALLWQMDVEPSHLGWIGYLQR